MLGNTKKHPESGSAPVPRRRPMARAGLAVLASIGLAACGAAGDGDDDVGVLTTYQAGSGTSALCPDTVTGKILCDNNYINGPASFLTKAGNFVAQDDVQLCYAIYGDTDFGERDLRGNRVEGPVTGWTTPFSITLSTNKQLLDWSTVNTAYSVLAFVIKGGNGYNLYDYAFAPPLLSSDQHLHSPVTQDKKGMLRAPEISHYNVCYEKIVDEAGAQGCTPGYWRNHADRWVEAVKTTDTFATTFGVTVPVSVVPNPYTLGDAIAASGGGFFALARHATAALLNAHGGVPNGDGTTVDYAYTVAEVIAMVQAAMTSGIYEATKDLFAAANEAGCPLSGTRAVSVQ
jgi:hypothetical protein